MPLSDCGHHTTSVVFRDPPDHTRIRRLFAPAFRPRALAALEPRIVQLVDRLLDRAADRGSMDVGVVSGRGLTLGAAPN